MAAVEGDTLGGVEGDRADCLLMLSKIKSDTLQGISLTEPSYRNMVFSPSQAMKLPACTIDLAEMALQFVPASLMPYTKGWPE